MPTPLNLGISVLLAMVLMCAISPDSADRLPSVGSEAQSVPSERFHHSGHSSHLK